MTDKSNQDAANTETAPTSGQQQDLARRLEIVKSAKDAADEAIIGRVVSVSGSNVVMLLRNGDDNSGPTDLAVAQIGTLVKMKTAATVVFGMVNGLSVPIPAEDPDENELRIVELELVGEYFKHSENDEEIFQRGVSFWPALGDPVMLASHEDLRQVYSRPSMASVRIGTIYQDQTLPAYVSVDDLLGKHFAILGTTGSGKSCAVTVVLKSILGQYGEGHIILLDLHGEYRSAFGEMALTLGAEDLELPYWLLNFDELAEIVIGESKEGREADLSILKHAVTEAKRRYRADADGAHTLTADVPVPYRLSELVGLINDALGRLDKPTDSAPYLRLKERLQTLQSDPRFAFMFHGLTIRDNMAAIISHIFRIPVAGKPITAIDLSSVPSEILNVVISLLGRLTFEFALWGDRAIPILFVCEEAHRYVGHTTARGFNMTKRTISRIAREGRKYGLSICLVSQRPSDLDVSILSQCNTIFAMRMSNQKDYEFVRATLSESASGILESLPALRTGEAIAVGEGVAVPARVCFDYLTDGHKPLSGTASFSSAWKDDVKDQAFVREIIDRWRSHRH